VPQSFESLTVWFRKVIDADCNELPDLFFGDMRLSSLSLPILTSREGLHRVSLPVFDG
jgi:hypothetical protein